MADHTPTPWQWDSGIIPPDGPGTYSDIYVNGGEIIIAQVNDQIEQGKANAEFIIKAVNHHDALVKALQVLLDEATSFSVSGVYFDEDCMGHKGPDLARKALELVGSPKQREEL